ncbi:MAG: DNA-directed RNA polymerase subunit beta', partial [Candidatus Latescibacterota bacterium]
GEVTKPETINYRSFKPERDGLFCERIFGPVKDWNCHCGKYKGIRYRGVVCDRCGVEVTQAKVRRERLGHIELAVPVSHIWYFKSLPSRIGALLDISMRNLERILYYESYVVLDPRTAPLETLQLVTEEELVDLRAQGHDPVVDMGAPAVRSMLAAIDIEVLSAELRTQVRMETSIQRKQEALKRLKVVEAFRQSENRPEWMVLEAVPVIPPDLRPLVPLEGGRFATSDLNDLYRRVINRNNRLKKLIQIKAPEVILRNEKRMLQEAVDALFDNGRRSRAVRGDGNRSLKSLSDLLKGKQGRFRQNLLGKRVDYSGRSVIVVGPELKLHQCGLPKSMALELFKPFVIKKLEEKGLVQTVKSAKKLVERERPEVWDILEEIIHDHCVLLNRAPTLHRLGIQAFQPILVEGKAIRLHPLVCAAFNADFDGDQMAVHVPLSFEAQIEARLLMLSANNLLKPADGEPVIMDNPQDIVLGCYYLTKVRFPRAGEKEGPERRFASSTEARAAYDAGRIGLHQPIKVRYEGAMIDSTVGRLIFNEAMPPEIGFINRTVDKGDIKKITAEVHRQLGNRRTAEFVDQLKHLGYHYATVAGITISIDDVVVPEAKKRIIDGATGEVEKVLDQYNNGIITDGERYNKIIDVWTHATSAVSRAVQNTLEQAEEGFNSLYIMKDSGARGSEDQIKQLGGMRGLMNKPQKKLTGAVGEIIETPIIASFKEGLSVLEYFISTHGARKGLADTALKTAEAGYLTRRMVDVAQDVVVTEDDCGTAQGLWIGALKDGEEIVEPLADRIVGRVLLEDAVDQDGRVIVATGTLIEEEDAARIAQSGLEQVRIRSVLTCEADRGVCIKCYGRNMASGKIVNVGEATGVIAAQSIGEPGTQLTLRTFHIGGTASRIAEQSQITSRRPGRVRFVNVDTVNNPELGVVVTGRNGELELLDEQNRVRSRVNVPYGAVLKVTDRQDVEASEVLYEWDPYNNVIISDRSGVVRFKDIVEGVTMREETDETTGLSARVIVEQRDRSLSPQIEVHSKDRGVRSYIIPVGARLLIHDEAELHPGQVLVKIPRERSKTRDITGGLPRVAELFEARRPKEPAVISEIDGTVRFGGLVRGNRELIVTALDGEERRYLIPYGKHLRVHDGDRVVAGERLSEGSINPHDILRVQGVHKVQEYLVNEIQDVYRLQAVEINDKHIEVIVRQMLQKVKVTAPGDTNFLEGEEVDKIRFNRENEKVLSEGGDPATCQPILLGITRASLRTDSFISAASFQETTRVLTEAAVQGKVDRLRGLKENVIIGRLIPAGTGMGLYSGVAYQDLTGDDGEAVAAEPYDGLEEEVGREAETGVL